MSRKPKELSCLAEKEKKRLKKEERKNNQKEKIILGPYRLFLIGDNVFRQDEFPGGRIPSNIKDIGKEI